VISHPIDLLDGRLYSGDLGDVGEIYAWLRSQNDGVWLDEKNNVWAAASYAAVRAASTNRATFSSAGGIRPDSPAMPMMIDMDAPEHTRRRKLVSSGFTPRKVQDKADGLVAVCDRIIDRICEKGHADFVDDIAAPLPMAVIGDMLGVPEEDWPQLLQWSDDLVSAQGGQFTDEVIAGATAAFEGYQAHALATIEQRRQQPTDDLFGVLVNAEVEGSRLADDELVFESLLILVGGDETTRHVLSGGMEALLRHPAQLEALRADRSLLTGAVEEMLRWVSPIKNMCRTATRDVEFHGGSITAGQKIMLLYQSANLDPARFESPETFDIRRHPNDHLAFGIGSHFCLGNNLARLELHVMIDRILDRLPDLRLADPSAVLPRRPANFVSGLTAMPVEFTPVAPVGA
jgi:cytochrome P450 family 142 subfamily A polypeptide 1